MKYNFDEILNRKNTNSVKWDNLEKVFNSNEVLPLWVADMDFASPKPVIEAIKSRADHGIYGYTNKSKSYYSSIVNWLKKRINWEIDSKWLIDAPGVVPSIVFSLLSFTTPKDKILIQSPVYHPFFASVEINDRELVNCPLKAADGYYSMNYEEIENKFKSGVKATILCNPHNPVGRVWTKEELKKFGELCLKYNVLIISDEIHSDIIYKGNVHVPIASISNELLQNTVTLIAPSKTFNIAGLTTSSVIIANKTLYSKFKATASKLWLDNNLFGVTALEAAYTYGEEWLTELIAYLQGNVDFLVNYIKERIPAIKVRKPEGTYLVWLDCRALNMDSSALKKFFIEKAKVGLNSGDMFGQGGEGFQRINIGCPRATLKEALERIEQAVNSLT